MSSMEPSPNQKAGVKTLAIRLEPDRHAQLSLLAQLRGSTITDEIRQAVETHVVSGMSDPDLAAQAETVLAEFDREASARRQAIATMFGTASAPAGSRRGSQRGKEGPSDG